MEFIITIIYAATKKLASFVRKVNYPVVAAAHAAADYEDIDHQGNKSFTMWRVGESNDSPGACRRCIYWSALGCKKQWGWSDNPTIMFPNGCSECPKKAIFPPFDYRLKNYINKLINQAAAGDLSKVRTNPPVYPEFDDDIPF